MTLIRFPHGHIVGKCHSIQTPKKPVQKVLFSRKNSNITHPIIYFNNIQAKQEKHLGIIFDKILKLNAI